MIFRLSRIRILIYLFFCTTWLLVISPLIISEQVKSQEPEYDLVILKGNVYNPESNHILQAINLGINKGRIMRMTYEQIKGKKTVDAHGLVVSPGFIDLVTYEPNHLGIQLKIHDGVTTSLLMHGGTNQASVWYSNWMRRGVAINYGASTFFSKIRAPLAAGIFVPIVNEQKINMISESVRNNIQRGTLGVSVSFEYIPGIREKELLPSLRMAKQLGAPSFYHLRFSDEKNELKGVAEVIDFAKKTGVAVHIMHLSSTGGTYAMDQALAMIAKARNEGLDITADIYPYNGWATYISSARFAPGWQQRFNINYHDLQLPGTERRLTENSFQFLRRDYSALAYAHNSIPEKAIRSALKSPFVMIASDTTTEPSLKSHPRGSGNYARLFGQYIREKGVISLMEGVAKSSLLPAQRMETIAPQMKNKGRIEIGADADLTIFNPLTIIDQSTVRNPNLPSRGVETVIVNGQLVKFKGKLLGSKSGQPIRSYFVTPYRERFVQTVIQAVYQADLTAQSASPNKLTSINQDIVSSNKTKDNKTKVVSDLPEVGAVKTILNKKSVSESVYQNKIERKQEKIVPHSSKKIITSQNNLNELKNNNRPKVWDIKAFNIEGYQFVPLEQTLKQLAISYQKKSDGTIVSKERSFSIRIGSRKINGSLKNKLSFEPIIFKGEIYIRARDLTKILDSNYVIVIEDNKLMIKKKRSRGQITGKVLSHLKN